MITLSVLVGPEPFDFSEMGPTLIYGTKRRKNLYKSISDVGETQMRSKVQRKRGTLGFGFKVFKSLVVFDSKLFLMARAFHHFSVLFVNLRQFHHYIYTQPEKK